MLNVAEMRLNFNKLLKTTHFIIIAIIVLQLLAQARQIINRRIELYSPVIIESV